MTKSWLLLAALLMAPLAQAHASPQPLDNEVQLLADDVDDYYAYHDGFDIQDLYVREYYERTSDVHGLAFRVVLFGGPGPVQVASEFHLDLHVTAGGTERTFRMTSSDGISWSGDMQALEGAMEAPDDVPFGLAGSLQFFVPFADLGVESGDTVGPFRVDHYADDDLRDLAPGGRPVPGTGGAVEVPESAASSREVTTSYLLDGPDGYTRSTLSSAGMDHEIEVQNLITVIGQHIILQFENDAGWIIEKTDTNPKVVEPGEHPNFAFTAVPGDDADTLIVRVASDLGGMEQFEIHPPHHMEGEDHGDHTPTDGSDAAKESPGPAFGLLLVALVAMALRRR